MTSFCLALPASSRLPPRPQHALFHPTHQHSHKHGRLRSSRRTTTTQSARRLESRVELSIFRMVLRQRMYLTSTNSTPIVLPVVAALSPAITHYNASQISTYSLYYSRTLTPPCPPSDLHQAIHLGTSHRARLPPRRLRRQRPRRSSSLLQRRPRCQRQPPTRLPPRPRKAPPL